MRVAIVHNFHSSETPSGENAVVEAEVAALERAGVDVRLTGVWNDELSRRPLNAVQAAATVATGIGVSPLRLLADFRPDIIHVHNLFPYLGHRWLKRTSAPIVTTLHSYRPLCASGYLFRAGDVCTLCPDGSRWSGVRYGCYRDSRLATLPLAWAGRRGAQGDPLLQAASRIIVLSDRARDLLVRAGAPEPRLIRDWHFLPDGDDPHEGGSRSDAWLFVGRLSEEKGIDRLVAEWPSHLPLRVLGDGPLRPSLERAMVGKRLDFLGRRSRSDVLVEMRRSFGLVFPSRWYETFGLVYMEALAAGLPTLAFRPNVVADAVEEDGTGVVASWEDLPEAITRARERFDGLRQRCRRVFRERYAEPAFVDRRVALYEGLLRQDNTS
jgi:glycosyltransferase involved in cell wall biosynthesis